MVVMLKVNFTLMIDAFSSNDLFVRDKMPRTLLSYLIFIW